MKTGDTVWIHPWALPDQAVAATVDIISRNKQSTALRLQKRPSWIGFGEGGIFLHRDNVRVEMLLLRESMGPWIELLSGVHYEIDKTKPKAGSSGAITLRRFPSLSAGDPSIGQDCRICGRAFEAGDETTLICKESVPSEASIQTVKGSLCHWLCIIKALRLAPAMEIT